MREPQAPAATRASPPPRPPRPPARPTRRRTGRRRRTSSGGRSASTPSARRRRAAGASPSPSSGSRCTPWRRRYAEGGGRLAVRTGEIVRIPEPCCCRRRSSARKHAARGGWRGRAQPSPCAGEPSPHRAGLRCFGLARSVKPSVPARGPERNSRAWCQATEHVPGQPSARLPAPPRSLRRATALPSCASTPTTTCSCAPTP